MAWSVLFALATTVLPITLVACLVLLCPAVCSAFLTIFVAKSTNGCKLEQPCTWSAVKFYSLQKLVLGYLCVNEEIIQDIIRCCPFITDFLIIGCHGLKNLEISKLPKLCKVEVTPLEQEVENIKVEAANLQHFSFTYSRQRQCLLDITACQNLKELYLTDLSITDQNLHFNISRFPTLKLWRLVAASCWKGSRFLHKGLEC